MTHIPSPSTRSASTVRPTIVVFGNQKGGSGKSTMAIHAIVAMLQNDYRVGAIDLDSRQGTLTRFFQNRSQKVADENLTIPCPVDTILVPESKADTISQKNEDEADALQAAYDNLYAQGCDIIVIDCPGSDTELSRLAHRVADTLVTPMNDSFIDLDLLAKINGKTLEIEQPSVYSDAVWQYRKERAINRGKPINWFIVRNRLSHINAQNKQNIQQLLEKLEKRFGFTFLNGFSERVIYRELFLKGLTLMDLHAVKDSNLNMSQLSARQEVRTLINAIGFGRGAVQTTAHEPVREKQVA